MEVFITIIARDAEKHILLIISDRQRKFRTVKCAEARSVRMCLFFGEMLDSESFPEHWKRFEKE